MPLQYAEKINAARSGMARAAAAQGVIRRRNRTKDSMDREAVE
jgi:hypothetical protein